MLGFNQRILLGRSIEIFFTVLPSSVGKKSTVTIINQSGTPFKRFLPLLLNVLCLKPFLQI